MKYNMSRGKGRHSVRLLALMAFLSFLLLPVSAEDAGNSSWVIAAAPFSGASDLSELLPSLILNNLPDSLEHSVDENEQIARKRTELTEKLPSLVSSMNSLIARRDAVVLTSDSQWKKNQTVADLDKQIADARKNLEDALAMTELEDFKPEEDMREVVALYRNDAASLISLAGAETPAEMESLATKEKIQALLEGSVQEIGNYLYVSVTVYRFPGYCHIGSVESVYPTTSANLLASEIAQNLLDVLENSAPVSISLDVLNAHDKVTVRLDGVPLVNWQQGFLTQAGVHHITVESSGCLTQGFTYDFSESDSYSVQVRLKPSEEVTLSVYPVTGGKVYMAGGSGVDSGAPVQVNGLPVLGETVSPDGFSTFFIAREKQPLFASLTGAVSHTVLPGSTVKTSVPSNAGDTSHLIDVRRRGMYTSFGLFLISLPVSFYCYGRMIDYAVQIDGRYDQVLNQETAFLWDDYVLWRDRSLLSMSVNGVLGVNWLIQLGRYIFAANKVLPRQVYVEPAPPAPAVPADVLPEPPTPDAENPEIE